MKTQRSLVFVYRQLLRLYPPGFRERFGEEMLEVAQAAELSEWPVILTDTGVTIVRTWLQPQATPSRSAATVQGEYLAIGETAVSPAKFLEGLALASALVLLACFISTRTVWHLPAYPDDRVCGKVPAHKSFTGSARL